MNTKKYGKFMLDLERMTCSNTENGLVVVFELKGLALQGKIKSMPLKLAQKWTDDSKCEIHIKRAIIEAYEVFFKEFFSVDNAVEERLSA
jgi:hypothetical protein